MTDDFFQKEGLRLVKALPKHINIPKPPPASIFGRVLGWFAP
jgi:hypothetical protein